MGPHKAYGARAKAMAIASSLKCLRAETAHGGGYSSSGMSGKASGL